MKNLIISILFLFFFKNSFAFERLDAVLNGLNLSPSKIEELYGNFQDSKNLKVAFFKVLTMNEDELKIKIYPEETGRILLLQNIDDRLELIETDKAFEIITETFEGPVRDNLHESILEDVGDERIATFIHDSFNADFSTTKKLRAKAYYSFQAEEIAEEGEQTILGNVLSAKVIVGKAIVEKVLMKDLENNTLVLKNIVPNDSERIFSTPLETTRVSSFFNLARRHPLKRRIQPHNGIDFVAPSGTPVFPALVGKVVSIGRTRSKGKSVLIEHENGVLTSYDHLRKFQKGLRVGMTVDIEDQIGEVGRTGYATGAHLHFTIMKNGQFVNPIYYLKDYQLEEDKENNFEEYENNNESVAQ